MILCVNRSDVIDSLTEHGFVLLEKNVGYDVFVRGDDVVIIRDGNLNGGITEIDMNEAFYSAGLEPPSLETHWCD